MKRAPQVTILLAAAVVVAALGLFLAVSRSGSGRLEQWIGSQLQEIVNSQINPQLSFADLDYQAPLTVSLKDLRLVADDPRSPGQSLDIISCGAATLTLAEVPRVGKPIIIEKVVLDKPAFSIVAAAPGAKKFVGYSKLLREPLTGAPTTQQRARLSEFLRMRLVQVIDGRFVYDPRIEGGEAMELDQINTTLKIEPAEGGWYKLGATIERKPVFTMSMAGQVSLDNFGARDAALKLRADLSPGQLEFLPPQLQKLLKRYDVRGALDAIVLGEFPILHPLEGEGVVDLTLSDAHVTFGEYQMPINRLEMSARLEDRVVHVPVFKVDALRGSMQASGLIQLNEPLDSEMKLQVSGMMLQDLLAGRKEGEPPKFAGKVDGEIEAAAPARVVTDKFRGRESVALSENWGSAGLRINEGSLLELPTLKKINQAISNTLSVVGAGQDDIPSDRLIAQASLSGDKANFTEMTFVGDVIAARGKGTIGLDQSLDLTLNAGPIEKMQDVLGQTVGNAIARITDKIVAYHVTGRLGQPQVEVQVAGGAMGKVGNTLDKIGQGIGDMVNPKDKQ